MEDKSDNILAQIRELRAEAGKSLQGNEYFAVALKLDALLANNNQDSADMQTGLQAIRSRLIPDAPGAAEPAVADGADKAVLEDIGTLRGEVGEALHGNDYFAAAQKIDALIAGDDLSSPATQETIRTVRDSLASGSKQESVPAKNEILENVIALRANAGKKLQGNDYFGVAQKLDALLAAGDLSAAPAGEALEQIRTLVEAGQEAAPTSDQSPDTTEQVTEPEAKTTIVFPKANSFSAPQPTVAVKLGANKDDEVDAPAQHTNAEPEVAQDATPVSSEMTHEADTVLENAEAPAEAAQQDMATEEKNGFDVLAEASWRRVREVAAMDEVPVRGMNGVATASDTEAGETEETQAPTEENIPVGTQEPAAEVPTEETAPAPETISAESQSTFRVTPRPTITNRPVRKERFVRLKRLAKLAHIPIRRD